LVLRSLGRQQSPFASVAQREFGVDDFVGLQENAPVVDLSREPEVRLQRCRGSRVTNFASWTFAGNATGTSYVVITELGPTLLNYELPVLLENGVTLIFIIP
jgi:hypothetical protein